VMYDRYKRVLVERDESRESERSLLAQVRAQATPATDEVERLAGALADAYIEHGTDWIAIARAIIGRG
jgi:hypothetical protein